MQLSNEAYTNIVANLVNVQYFEITVSVSSSPTTTTMIIARRIAAAAPRTCTPWAASSTISFSTCRRRSAESGVSGLEVASSANKTSRRVPAERAMFPSQPSEREVAYVLRKLSLALHRRDLTDILNQPSPACSDGHGLLLSASATCSMDVIVNVPPFRSSLRCLTTPPACPDLLPTCPNGKHQITRQHGLPVKIRGTSAGDIIPFVGCLRIDLSLLMVPSGMLFIAIAAHPHTFAEPMRCVVHASSKLTWTFSRRPSAQWS